MRIRFAKPREVTTKDLVCLEIYHTVDQNVTNNNLIKYYLFPIY